MSFKFRCVHLSDIHFRGLTRHSEYKKVFEDFFEKCLKIKPDLIYVGGDIVHSKTQGISPELIDILNWWFSNLGKIAPTHIILGNHDGLIMNKDRQDAISPIINALDPTHKRLKLYKKSGVYPTGIDGFNWCVFSCFDEENWENVTSPQQACNIALFHGGVAGSTTDIDWQIEADTDLNFFKHFDFAFLGDIHKVQFLNEERTVAYSGSTIQQNYGEDPTKGFLLWEINDSTDFNVEFIELINPNPYITIEWLGNAKLTMESADELPEHARYRIKAPDYIPQVEIKKIHRLLKEKKFAEEVVYKYDNTDTSQFDMDEILDGTSRNDLTDPKTYSNLMRQLYCDSNIHQKTWEKIDELTIKYLRTITENENVLSSRRWSIKNLEFDNLFSYGKGNRINFEKLNGIIGIFGKNRVGKSSIPGAVMYGLYNTTDRGPIKNLHIINSRKGHCHTKMDISVNGKLFRVERQSVKHQAKNGDLHASTHLNLSQIDKDGNEIKDLNGEQRRETDKVLRKLIGTPEDFLLTSLASQGEMNSFIKNGATQRKAILSKFLDLDLFEKMLNLAKDESAEIKVLLKNMPEIDWVHEIKKKGKELKAFEQSSARLLVEYQEYAEELKYLNIHLSELLTDGEDLDIDLDAAQAELQKITEKNKQLVEKRERLVKTEQSLQHKLKKISNIKCQFPIDDLRKNLELQEDFQADAQALAHLHDKEYSLLHSLKTSASLLKQVPCGTSYPTCQFIKKSHSDVSQIGSQKSRVQEIFERLNSAKSSLLKLTELKLKEKIDKYSDLLQQESNISLEISQNQIGLRDLESELGISNRQLKDAKACIVDATAVIGNNDNASLVHEAKKQLKMLEERLERSQSSRIKVHESIAVLQKELTDLQESKCKYEKLQSEWNAYSYFMSAVSKKGIPLHIMMSQLPLINKEISKILQGVVGFTVELEASAGSNDMDIYINYGDSKRVIELASGMEKMLSSLAIRVALINISRLPKSDILFIDEGFGALDEMNVEACNRLLNSLKKWFKCILVISHVDAVKDAVDNVLEITHRRKDSKVLHG